jgi:hypothetical protein
MRLSVLVARAGCALAALALAVVPASAAPFDGRRGEFADAAFRSVWARTDDASVRGGRSWYWGPQPWFDYAEFYREGVNGLRTVQYFDKARMEINNPNDRSVQGGATNGLLVVELVSGHLKKGNDPADFEMRPPAAVPVAGNPAADNPNGPAYAAFANIATYDNNGYRDASRLGQPVSASLDSAANIAFRQDLADAHPETAIAQYNSNTGHNIPQVFWNFMNQSGTVLEDGAARTRPLADWLFAMGLPISDAYWVRAKIGAAEKDVLVQLFERRVLTYVPDNPAGFQVEMGNVGQHYFQWRYPNLGQPWAASEPQPPLIFSSNFANRQYYELFAYQPGGNIQLTGNPIHPATIPGTNSVAFSFRRSFEPTRQCLLYDSPYLGGQYRKMYQLPMLNSGATGEGLNTCQPMELLFYEPSVNAPPDIAAQPGNDTSPSLSPDGTKLAFLSDRFGVAELFLAPVGGTAATRLTDDRCVSAHPGWSPDGRTLFWERQCSDGHATLMRGDLRYADDGSSSLRADLVNVRELTDPAADNRSPRVAPGGRAIAFTSYRDGNAEIYTMDTNGGAVRRLTSNAAEDEAPAWNADGSQIAFASNRDGDYDIFIMNADGSGQAPLTGGSADDRWPSWAQ